MLWSQSGLSPHLSRMEQRGLLSAARIKALGDIAETVVEHLGDRPFTR
jgi:hypothetical protein